MKEPTEQEKAEKDWLAQIGLGIFCGIITVILGTVAAVNKAPIEITAAITCIPTTVVGIYIGLVRQLR
jgi:hypothetical protein